MPGISTLPLSLKGKFSLLFDRETLLRHVHPYCRGVLLIGGAISPSTAELIPIENGKIIPSVESEKFVPKNSNQLVLALEQEWLHHCTIQVRKLQTQPIQVNVKVSTSTILLTGGWETETMVLELSSLDGDLEQVLGSLFFNNQIKISFLTIKSNTTFGNLGDNKEAARSHHRPRQPRLRHLHAWGCPGTQLLGMKK